MSIGTIIYIGGFKMPDGNAAAQRVLGNSKILRDLGYNVVFIDISESCDTDILKTKHEALGFDVWSIRYPKSNIAWFKYITEINRFISVSKQYSDIKAVIVYNYPAVALHKLHRYCKKNYYKLIADCTEWYPKSKNIVKNIDSTLRMNKIHYELDGIIAISHFLYEYYSKKMKAVYIPPLIDIQDAKWNINREDNSGIVFTYAGVPGMHKDKLNLIIEALTEIKTMKKYTFNIVGLTKEQYLQYYPEHEPLLESLIGKVSFKGRVTHREAINYVKRADYSLFFRPDTLVSRAGFPTKFVEAVTCATPVITNKTSDLGEFIRDGENTILIDGYKKKDIIDAINRIFDLSRDEVNKIKENCEAMRSTFDYRNYTDSLGKFIEEVSS